MSPLAPHSNNNQTSNYNIENQQNLINAVNILSTFVAPKVTYSIGNLYGMRHSQSRAPNLGNRNVLASISRPSINQSGSNMDFANAISFNIMSSNSNRMPNDRRQTNQNRPTSARQQYTRNGDVHNERYRQPNRGKCQLFFFSLTANHWPVWGYDFGNQFCSNFV